MLKIKKNRRVRDHCQNTKEYRDAAHSLYNLKYNYQFIIKELAEEFEEEVTCFGKKILENR